QSENERSAEYYYRSRTTYTTQLTGSHAIGAEALDWSASYAYANRRLPDRRKYILYNEDPQQSDQYVWLYKNDISREWTSLDEHILSLQANDSHRFTFGQWQPMLKAGIYGEYRTRTYNTRNLLYWYNTDNNLPDGFRSMGMTTLLSDPANFGADKLYLLEDVNKINDYSGNNLLGAAYAMATLPLGKVDVHAGLRYEYNQMELISNTKASVVSHESHYYRHGDLFPSANMTWHISDQHQARLCYGRSINRPEFRELSPSVYYDFDLASNVQGNYDLKNCYVDNIDLRYEWYPSRGEVISLAAFYKHFDSPIEWVYTLSGGTDVVYSYKNARSADNYGLELDIRKSLDFIGLKDFSWSFNGSLIHSRVHFEPGSYEYDRPMQGQSPYLINTGLFYNNQRHHLSVNLLYNRIGKRIVGVGRTEGGSDPSRNIRVPDSYEMPRDAFDLTASKRWGRWEVKLAVRDLLNQNILFKQFQTVEGKEIQQVTRKYKPGRNINLSVTVTL
ncbi:MAG TPA: ligand-gated channel protein, partial [Prevotella sp.]|nr:ligand-gated channel protein [Prevotella sp.]